MKEVAAKRLKILFIILIFVLLLVFINLVCSNNILKTTDYNFRTKKVNQGFTLLQLTDLHNYTFGKDNEHLVKRIRVAAPDLILMTGDMLNGYEPETSSLEMLISNLQQIAPVYFSLGNHETEYISHTEHPKDLVSRLEKAGAVVLEQEYTDITINGQEIRLGGLYGYALAEDYQDGAEQRFLEKFEDTHRLKILLAHVPEGLLLWKSMEKWKIDLIFSGHVHGGQARLPFIGGLYDPEEGWFPTYTKGMFQMGHGTMILSAGLGSSRGIPRFNNLPEIVVCKIDNKIIRE